MADIKATLARLEPTLARIDLGVRKLEIDLAEARGRISQMPTTLALIAFALAVLTAGGLMRHFDP